MKVRVSYTVYVDDDYRRAINNYHGEPGLATREEVKEWLRLHGESMNPDIMQDLENALQMEGE